MPGVANIGEGFIRSHELLEELNKDILLAYQELEENRDSQFLRRNLVRCIFSFIEAVIETIRAEIKSSLRCKPENDIELTNKEEDFLGALPIFSREKGKFIPLDQSIKLTFKLAAKVWRLKFRLDTDGESFRSFKFSKAARNRLTHPKTFYDIEITDEDMHHHSVAGMWVKDEFQRLFQARIYSLTQSFEEDEGGEFIGKILGDA